MKRTNLILGALVIALFAYVTLVERFGLSSGELEERQRNFVPSLVTERLVRIEVIRGGARYVLVRSGRDSDGNSRYELTAPIRADVESETVAEALGTIEWAEPVRVLEGATSTDRARFGIDRPRLELRFEVADRTIDVLFGRDEPTGAGVYAEAEGKFYVVAREVVEAFDHSVDHFRVRRIATVPESVDRIRVVRDGLEVRLERVQSTWRMKAPFDALASEGRANVVLSTARTLEAMRFVDESGRDLARFGLDRPSTVVELGDAAHPDRVKLAVGRACAEGDASHYVRAGQGPIVCVADDDLESLAVEPLAYLELRASATETGGVTGVALHDGSKTLTVSEVDDVLHFALGDLGGDADPEAFEEWVEGLRTTRAVAVRALGPAFTPTITLTVHRTQSRPDDVVRFMPRPGEVWARRGEEPSLLVFAPTILDRLVVSTTHVRSRSLLREDPSSIESITLERPTGIESLRKGEGGALSIVAPSPLSVETARVVDLAARLAGLEAVRFVSDTSRPEYGLDRPRFVVRFAFAASGSPTEHRLDVGAPIDAGAAYARLDGAGPVFVLVAETVELVASPLASRQELATESLFVDSIEVRRPGGRAVLARNGANFSLDGGPVEERRASAAVNAVADLRADSVAAYGPPTTATGLARPATQIRIVRAAEAPAPREIVLDVGASVGEGDERRTYVRRSDRPVTYLVRAESLAPILALRP